eukprot:1574083-Pyramimonas_sp.AAC.1
MRAADMERGGLVIGVALGHGSGASLADSLFQPLVEVGWCAPALASDEGRRVACAACAHHLQNLGD